MFALTPMPIESYTRAEQLARRHTSTLGTHSLDIPQAATALALKPDVFFTFDERQRRLAKAKPLRALSQPPANLIEPHRTTKAPRLEASQIVPILFVSLWFSRR